MRTLTPTKEDAKKGEDSEEKEEAKDAEKEKKDEPKKKDDTNKEDKNKDKHEEAINTKNETKNNGHTPRIKHSSMSDITQYLSRMPYKSLFGNYIEVSKRNRKDEDESPPVKPKTKKEKKNIRKEQHSSGIPKNSGGQAGSK